MKSRLIVEDHGKVIRVTTILMDFKHEIISRKVAWHPKVRHVELRISLQLFLHPTFGHAFQCLNAENEIKITVCCTVCQYHCCSILTALCRQARHLVACTTSKSSSEEFAY
uniref:Uncharacterized protein n=1 Tax=Opuntia streptacantha TaxID=393608 RepID=A0A7C9DII8_OPUST